MFEKYCDYCDKPITSRDYMVHLHYPKLDGIHEEYYHLQCYYEKRNKEQRYTMLNEIKLPLVTRCSVCGTIIKARSYNALLKKLKRHTEKCLKKGYNGNKK